MPLDPQSESLWREAFDRLPFPRLLEQRGEADLSNRGAICPFCQARHKFGVFRHKTTSRWFFKCHKPECPANDPPAGCDEIGWLALRGNLSRSDAALEYLKLALPEKASTFDLRPSTPPPATALSGRRSDAETCIPSGPFHALWQKLTLNSEDFTALKKKRGFTDETIRECGFRSNGPQNEPHLDWLAEAYHPDELIASGLYKDAHPFPTPAGQLRGYDTDGKLTSPLVIPYFSADGLPYWLRPHKGGLTRPRDPDEQFLDDDERPCHAEIYIPPGTADLITANDGICVITEGEFKGAALRQCRIGSLVIPGIQMFRNREFFNRLTRLLDQFGVQQVVIIYDNEVQDDPAIPERFKQDPWKRNEALVYAIVLQRELRWRFQKPGMSCRIGKLPDELRERGKADFDGILAKMVRDHGETDGTKHARKIFLKSIKEAVTSDDRGTLFPTQDERIINWRVQRLEHTPKLITGGEREMTLANLCRTRCKGPTGYIEKADPELAEILSSTVGCYYIRKFPSKDDRAELEKRKSALIESRDHLKNEVENPPANVVSITAPDEIQNSKFKIQNSSPSTDPEKVALLAFTRAKLAAVIERLKGKPERISDCTIDCQYRVHTAAGVVDRLVRIKNSKDLKRPNPKLFRLTAGNASSHQKFREWLFATGEGVWHEGQKALEELKEDLDHQAYLRDIYEINSAGLDTGSGIWFAEDCAHVPSSSSASSSSSSSPPTSSSPRIYPDPEGIYWHGGLGYRIKSDNQSTSSNSFAQGLPRFTKPAGLTKPLDSPGFLQRFPPPDYLPAGAAHADIAGLFKTISQDVYDTIGDYQGWIGLGLFLAYAIAPELLRTDGHPAPWFNGQRGQGKSTFIRLLMRIWGFRHLEGIPISETSPNAVSRILAQYSNLPVFFDEARPSYLDDRMKGVFRNAFQHQPAQKGKPTDGFETYGLPPRTVPVIGGESTSDDAALNSRFGFVQVVGKKRLGDERARYLRMLTDADHYYRLGDWLLCHRADFARTALDLLAVFTESPTVRKTIADPRIRFVHGTAFACMKAMCDLLDIREKPDPDRSKGSYQFEPSPESQPVDHRPRTMNGFYDFLLTHGSAAYEQTQEEDFLHRFWVDVIHGIDRKKGAPHAFFLADIQWEDDGSKYKVRRVDSKDGSLYGKPASVGWKRVCFVVADTVFASYSIDYRQQNQKDPPLRLGDIKAQMVSAPYYVPPPKNERSHRPKFHGQRVTCLCISMEEAPRPAEESDESGEASEPTYLFPLASELLVALTPSAAQLEDE